FTLVLCGLGLHAAATLHLVAHGFYKAALFLGSGSTVRALVRSRTAPPATGTPVWATLAAGLAVGAAAVAALAASGAGATADVLVPVGLAVVAGTCASRAWLGRAAPGPQQGLGVVVPAASVATFAVASVALKGQVGPWLDVDPALHAAWIVPVLLGLAAVAWARAARPTSATAEVIWDLAARAGRPTSPRPLRAPATEAPAPRRPGPGTPVGADQEPAPVAAPPQLDLPPMPAPSWRS
ncbi:MAG TPA: hypothetical protein VHK88_17670, partial [Aquihabitans sp.]|nr:hypothetical protein [Aquihabitans sp.]